MIVFDFATLPQEYQRAQNQILKKIMHFTHYNVYQLEA